MADTQPNIGAIQAAAKDITIARNATKTTATTANINITEGMKEIQKLADNLAEVLRKLPTYELEEMADSLKDAGKAMGEYNDLTGKQRLAVGKALQIDLQKYEGLRNSIPDLIKATEMELTLGHARSALGRFSNREITDINKRLALYDKELKSASGSNKALLQQAKHQDLLTLATKDANNSFKSLGSRIPFVGGMLGNVASKEFGAIQGAFKSVFGSESLTLAKYAGPIGIVAAVLSELFKGMSSSVVVTSLAVRANDDLNASVTGSADAMYGASIKAGVLNLSMEDFYKQVGTAVDMYYGELTKVGSGNKLGIIANQVLKIDKSAAFFGQTSEDAIVSAGNVAKTFGVAMNDVGNEYTMFASVGNNIGLRVKDMSNLLITLGDSVKYTTVGGLRPMIAQLGEFHLKMRKTFGSLAPEITAAATTAFSKITAAEYLAYSGAPVTNFGESYMAALSKTPWEKISAFGNILTEQAAAQGGGTQGGRQGIMAVFLEKLQLPPNMTAGLAKVFEKMTSEEWDRMQGKSASQVEKFISETAAKKGLSVEALGGIKMAGEDPMAMLIKIGTAMLRGLLIIAGSRIISGWGKQNDMDELKDRLDTFEGKKANNTGRSKSASVYNNYVKPK